MTDTWILLWIQIKKSMLIILKLNRIIMKKKLKMMMKMTLKKMKKVMMKMTIQKMKLMKLEFQCEGLNVRTKASHLIVMGIT